MTKLTILLTVLPLLVSAPVFARDQEPLDRDAIVAKHIGPLIEGYEVPGAVVGIYADGTLSFHPIGTLDYGSEQSPDESTMYEIGSISKVMTGVFFADAVRRGEVTKHTKLQSLVPEDVTVPIGEDGTEIELWNLTTHTSGWGTVPINLLPSDADRPFFEYSEDMLWDAINRTPLTNEPGTKLLYSNFAVGALGTVLARNAHGAYEPLVKQRVFAPLQIEGITITLDPDQQSRLAPATRRGLSTKSWGGMGPLDPAGMWMSSAPSLMKFAMESISDPDEDAPAIYESLSMSREPLFFSKEMGQQVCFGWFIARDGQSHWHNGMTGGYSSYMGVNKPLGIAIVVLTNGATFATTVAGEKIFQELAGMHPDPIALDPPAPLKPDLADRLEGTYRSQLGFDIEIKIEHGLLFARVTNQTFNRLHPVEGNARFRFDSIDAELGFDLPEGDDPASSVTLFQNGAEMKCVRVEE